MSTAEYIEMLEYIAAKAAEHDQQCCGGPVELTPILIGAGVLEAEPYEKRLERVLTPHFAAYLHTREKRQ